MTIDGPKNTRRTPVDVAKSVSTPSSSASSVSSTSGTSSETATPRRSSGHAKRALERIGRAVSMKPAPEVPVDERAGKTAAVHQAKMRAGAVFAAIDLGSSDAKMLVQKVGADGVLRTVLDEKIGCALGRDVQNDAPIPDANQERALAALRQFVDDAQKLGVSANDIPLITTAVVRNSTNGDAFVDAVKALGLTKARVLRGEDEAAIGFAGAIAMMKGKPGRYATLDLGGGSFQLAIGTEKGVDKGGSTQIGSNVILSTMLVPAANADGVGDAKVFDDVDAKLRTLAPLPIDPASLAGHTLVATGGVSKFLRAHVGKDTITRNEIDALRRSLIAMPYEERVDVVTHGKDDATKKALGIDTHDGALEFGKKLPASASLLLRILDGIGVDEVRVSETDARHALIANEIARS